MTKTVAKMKKLNLTILAIIALIFGSFAYAADPEDLQKLMDTNNCMSCDLRGVDLKGATLWDAYLKNADLRGADLSNANLSNAILIDADFRTAILKNTILSNVIYCRTKMPWGEENNDC